MNFKQFLKLKNHVGTYEFAVAQKEYRIQNPKIVASRLEDWDSLEEKYGNQYIEVAPNFFDSMEEPDREKFMDALFKSVGEGVLPDTGLGFSPSMIHNLEN